MGTSELTHAGVQRFQAVLIDQGWSHQAVQLPQTTRRASDAAAAVGCSIAQIAKSLVFQCEQTARPILVIASGQHRVDEARVAAYVGEGVVKPDADYVRLVTGYVIGGVPPFGHAEPLLTVIDAYLLEFDEIWAAAGSPNAVFRLTPTELMAMTGGHIMVLNTEP